MEISLNKSLNKGLTATETEILASEKEKLLLEIKKSTLDLEDAYCNFNYVQDSLMIDYYTYQIKAIETRFEYLIKKAKELGMTL